MQKFREHLLYQQIRQSNINSGDPEVDELTELALELRNLWQPDPGFARCLERDLQTWQSLLPKSTPRRTKPLERVREDG